MTTRPMPAIRAYDRSINRERQAEVSIANTFVLGFPISNVTLIEAAQLVISLACKKQKSRIAFLNAHGVNIANSDPSYGRVLSRSDHLFADGSGLSIAARLFGSQLRGNVNGTDLFPLICKLCARTGLKIYLLGGRPGIAAAAGRNMVAKFPKLDVVGSADGYFDKVEEKKLIQSINQSGADILMVGLGVPYQDKWIERNQNKMLTTVNIGVGGLFDYYSNRIPRAPLAWRQAGMEWVWRLMQEPRRLASRYIAGNARFLMNISWRRVAGTALGARIQAVADAIGLAGRPLTDRFRSFTKRAFDVVVSSIALVLFAPVLAATGIAVCLESHGPAFFVQTRVGLNGRPFTMWKFRSMRLGAEQAHPHRMKKTVDRCDLRFKARHDPRITRVGQWIRRYSIDELPQFWNVLRGDMSLVGPRPATVAEVARYDWADRERLLVKPGITCTWQVSGRADIPFPEQVEMDRSYIQSQSFWGDVCLLFRTMPAVVSCRGAY